MKLTAKPVTSLKGSINLPASKSYSIRAFMTAALGGTSEIIRPSNCDDAKVSMHAAQSLGSKITVQNGRFKVVASLSKKRISQINVKESGTVLRLILPLLALLGQRIKVTGEGTLKGRPNSFLLQTLRKMGVRIKGTGKLESIPIVIEGGQLSSGDMTIDGSLSSQFVSALLLTCPLLSADSRLKLSGTKLVSRDYITMTLQVLKRAGIQVVQENSRLFLIKGKQKYKGLKSFVVPSDYGLAAFPLAACSLISSEVVLKGFLKSEWVQADQHILSILKKMGVSFHKTVTEIKIRGPFKIKGGEFSLKDCPDLVPIVAVLALFADSKVRLYDIGHARAKESDRISDLRHELLKVGAKIKESKNELLINPQTVYRTNVTLDPHKDHRLAMAFTILGLKLGCRVNDIQCISKSYPSFVRDMKSIGAPLSIL